MLQVGKVYELKDGRRVRLAQIYQDFFSQENYVILQQGNAVFIASMREFEASIISENRISKRTTQEKVSLYRSYFRGRDELIATSFKVSLEKRVYYPWCLSRKKAPCPKVKIPKFSCSVCKYQNFKILTDQDIIHHLRGKDKNGREVFLGMYPLLTDNTVYFLAIDFDNEEWRRDVQAVTSSAEKLGFKPLLEISQSGEGCHIWFFFDKPVAARTARLFGSLLLRLTMLANPELSFESYDRMFPSQDELVTGGFGNLIALPLQGERVEQGCSRFVDKNFQLIQDIWTSLEETPKITVEQVNKAIASVQKELPVTYYEPEKKDVVKEITLFEESETQTIFDTPIHVDVNSQLEIQRKNISDKELVQLKFLATFYNKNYFIAQKKRLSTYNIPRFICLAEIDNLSIRLPRGLEEKLQLLFPNAKFIDNRASGKQLSIQFNGSLYKSQETALTVLKQKDIGILCVGTGFGKTVVAAKLIADKQVSTLILVHNKNLASQWKAQLERFLTIDDTPIEEVTKTGRKRKKSKIGSMYGGKISRSGLVDIALFQTISKQENLTELLQEYGMVIVDEAHHVAAKTFEDVIKLASCKYLYGLTATPKREDHLENILFMRLGEVSFTAEKQIPQHILQKLFIRFTSLGEQIGTVEQQTLHDNYEMMVADENRNHQIVEDILTNLSEKRHIILLSRYVKHLNVLRQLLEEHQLEVPIYVLNGKMKNKQLREELLKLKVEGKAFVLLTTGSYAGEGFDLPALDTLMLAMPISGKGSLQQYLGRLLRNLEVKQELRVYDYVDYAIPMVYRMYQKRLRAYKNLGYDLFEDEFTSLHKSNLFDKNYEDILLKDLMTTKKNTTIILPFLNSKLLTVFLDVNYDDTVLRKLVLPDINRVASNFKNQYSLWIEELQAKGYQISFRGKITQSFVVIDDKIVWMLPNVSKDTEDTVALRMYSQNIAKRLNAYFEKK